MFGGWYLQSIVQCWLVAVLCVCWFHTNHVNSQALSGVPINANITKDIRSYSPGSWIIQDLSNITNIHPSKRNSTNVVELGVINTLPGGPHGYKVPNAALLNPSQGYNWCIIAGFVGAMMDTNASPDLLPGRKVQLVLGNDGNDPAKAVDLAQDIYSLTRPSSFNLTESTKIIVGSQSADISRSVASVARLYNVPFVSYWTDSVLLPVTQYPTLLSHAESYDVMTAALANFVYERGWQRVATLSTLDVGVLAESAHFAQSCVSLNITVSSREVFDETLTDPSTGLNPSLEAAVARLAASDVRIVHLGCQQDYSGMILDSLERAGMTGAKYQHVGNLCIGGMIYTPLVNTKPWAFRSLVSVGPNSQIPDDPTRLAAWKTKMGARYKANPDSLFNCNAGTGVGALYATLGYQFASVAIQGLHKLQDTKQQCQLPENQQLLDQVLPIAQVKAMGTNFNCITAMKNTTWNTQLGIDCCRLDPLRSPYYRAPDPFGPGAYINGDGPVLIDALKTIRLTGLMSTIGIQRPEAPVANLVISNFLPKATGGIGSVTRQVYKSSSCNVATNVCKWNTTTLSAYTFGDGTTNVPDDGVIRYIATIQPSTAGRGVLVGFAVFGMIFILIVSIIMWRYRQLKSIKSSSITFVMLILFAAAAALSTIITLYNDDQSASCQARIWIGHLSFSILFGSLLLKTYRLAAIFDNRALRVKAKTDLHLLGLLGIYVAAVSALLISWMVRHAPNVVFKLQSDGRAGYYTCQSSNYLEMWILLGIHGAALLWGIYLCVKSQDVFAELNESKQIALSIYNVVMLSALVVAIDQGLNLFSVDMTFYVYACGILLGAVTTVSLLTSTKLMDVYRYYRQHAQGVQRQTLTKADNSSLGNSKAGISNVVSHGAGGHHRSSVVSVHVSDVATGVTPTDWMKLDVFTRKCYEATKHNNIGRLMVEQNKVFTLLMQIYQDAANGRTRTEQTAQPDAATGAAATGPGASKRNSGSSIAGDGSAPGFTALPSAPSRPGSSGIVRGMIPGFIRHRSSQSADSNHMTGPFQVTEAGVRLEGGIDAAQQQIQQLFGMHQSNRSSISTQQTPTTASNQFIKNKDESSSNDMINIDIQLSPMNNQTTIIHEEPITTIPTVEHEVALSHTHASSSLATSISSNKHGATNFI